MRPKNREAKQKEDDPQQLIKRSTYYKKPTHMHLVTGLCCLFIPLLLPVTLLVLSYSYCTKCNIAQLPAIIQPPFEDAGNVQKVIPTFLTNDSIYYTQVSVPRLSVRVCIGGFLMYSFNVSSEAASCTVESEKKLIASRNEICLNLLS